MADRLDNEVFDLMVEQSKDEARDNPDAKKKAGRHIQAAFPVPRKVPGAMFAPRRFLPRDNYLSSKPAPAPNGPPAAQLIEEAKRRRREREQEESNRR